jgi:lipopolysaccharide export LptBFGC system permease protein LptF
VPSALTGLWMSFFSLFLFMEMIPWAHFEIRNKPREMLQKFISVPSSGVKDIKLSNCRIQCDACERGTFIGVRIVMTDQNSGRISEVYRARECLLKLVETDTATPSLLMILRGVSVEKYKRTEKGDECDVATVVEMPLVIDLSHVLQTKAKTIDDMSALQVLVMMEPGTVTKYTRARILTELNKRAALSLAPLLFIMLGTLLGATTSVGHKVGGLVVNMTLSCVMVFLVYYPMAVFGEQLGWKEKFNPWLAPWLADAILLVVIAGLLWKLVRR